MHDGFQPSPGPCSGGALLLGDFDGNGVLDAAAHLYAATAHTWLVPLPQGQPGEGVLLDHTSPMAVADVDGDGDDELLLRLLDDDFHLWVVGSGSEALPRLGSDATEVDAGLGEAVRDLLGMGFDQEAAEALRALAEARGDDHGEALGWSWGRGPRRMPRWPVSTSTPRRGGGSWPGG